jgi:hypothetical protein
MQDGVVVVMSMASVSMEESCASEMERRRWRMAQE